MNQTHLDKLKLIFRLVLDLPDDVGVTSLRRITTRKWDSLVHVSLVAAIESEFNVKLDSHDGERMSSFEGTRLLLEDKGL